MDDRLKAFERLLTIMDELREQCPWDKKQTLQSLRNLTIEEVYELADAITENDLEGVKEEIGDIMLHMVFYARIGSEQEAFNITTALHAICDKLVKRHPHIYGDLTVEDDTEVKKNWEKLKLQEGKRSVLSGVPNSLPAMIKAYRMQEKTAQVGFEWDRTEQVWDKVKEEMDELHFEVIQNASSDRIEEEFGDLLFSLINYARFIKVDPESALEKVNKKFKKRFEYIEANAPKSLDDMTLEEMDLLWNDAKGQEGK